MTEQTIHNIYPIYSQREFSQVEAQEMIDLFLTITGKAKNKINGLNSRIEFFKNQPELSEQLQLDLNMEIQKWSDKMRRLGGTPTELYKAKIPTVNGYFSWEFPSVEIEFYADQVH